jgi:hypothetical protein
MKWIVRGIVCAAGLLAAACALAEGPTPTPPPPITLAAPPPLVLQGDCETTGGLDSWLQSSVFYVTEFQAAVNRAAGLQRGELFDTVVMMARIRDAASETAAPECAVPVHLMMVETFKSTVDVFQMYANGERDNLGNTVVDTIGQLDRIVAGQNELKARLEAQYRQGTN